VAGNSKDNREDTMIKDLLVNLAIGIPDDATVDCAIALAQTFDAHLAGFASPDAKPADVLLSHAADTSADLLVLGGYGHSRLREFVLGGVTRSILDTMTVPTLMSH
jgi:nucleotide-binding universal stress UspA family protein